MLRPNEFKKIRVNIAFVVGLTAAAGIAMAIDRAPINSSKRLSENSTQNEANAAFQKVARRKLSVNERKSAVVAWSYFENNTQPNTGLVNSVNGFPSTTMWDLGSYLFALTAARKLELITQGEMQRRIALIIETLSKIQLVDGYLPNKVYNTQLLEMTDYSNNTTASGIGWSALDMGRLLLALASLRRVAPEYSQAIGNIINSWSLNSMVKDGMLFGSTRMSDGTLELRQEGRMGYEQYAARAAMLYGLDVLSAVTAFEKLSWRRIQGIKVPIDLRSFRDYGAITPISSEPYFMTALEMGLDSESNLLAYQVYRAQEKRYLDTGLRTMVSEDHVDKKPYFLYGTVFGNGKNWAVLGEDGTSYPELRTVSLKSAFAWNAIYNTKYTRETVASLDKLQSTGIGWMAGLYETSRQPNSAVSLNTNAVVLEALHYTVFGPFLNSKK